MKIIPPIKITEANLVSHNVVDADVDDYDEWSGATIYYTGDRVKVTTTGKVYESRKDLNFSASPPTNLDEAWFEVGPHELWSIAATYSLGNRVIFFTSYGVEAGVYESLKNSNTSSIYDTTAWVYVGSRNLWRMLDRVVGSQTENKDSINIKLSFVNESVSSFSLLNLEGTSLEYKYTVPSISPSPIIDEEISLVGTSGVIDGWTYFFGELATIQNIEIQLPIFSSFLLEITINNPGIFAKCGELLLGHPIYMGGTQFGAGLGILDYSTKTVDGFGNYTILQKTFSKKCNFDVTIDNSYLEYFFNTLQNYRSTPLLWVGSDESFAASATTVYGFYKDFSIVIPYPSESACSIEVEGLI